MNWKIGFQRLCVVASLLLIGVGTYSTFKSVLNDRSNYLWYRLEANTPRAKTVNIPEIGDVEFPKSMSNEYIENAIRTNILPAYQKAHPSILDGLPDQTPPKISDWIISADSISLSYERTAKQYQNAYWKDLWTGILGTILGGLLPWVLFWIGLYLIRGFRKPN